MEKSDFDLRFVASGLSVLAIFLAALCIMNPRLLRQFGSMSTGLLLLAGSGGLGFLFAQIYFSLSWSIPDHYGIVQKIHDKKRSLEWIRSICDVQWIGAVTTTRGKCQRKRPAQKIVHYVWRALVSENRKYKGLNDLTKTLAAKRAAIGATLVGLVTGLVLFLLFFFPRSAMSMQGCVVPCAIASVALFVIPLVSLYLLHQSLKKEIEDVVLWTLCEVLELERCKDDSTARHE